MPEFPTLAELDAMDRADFRAAVAELGGVGYWARRLGKPMSDRRVRAPYDIDAAIAEARLVVIQHGLLPSEPALRRLGFGRLATEVRRAGGARRFAKRHQLTGFPTGTYRLLHEPAAALPQIHQVVGLPRITLPPRSD